MLSKLYVKIIFIFYFVYKYMFIYFPYYILYIVWNSPKNQKKIQAITRQ